MTRQRFPARVPLRQIALLLAVTVLIAVLNTLREARRAPPSDSYSTNDAFRGGYLAWYELLEREGVVVGRFEERLPFLDRATGVLIVTSPPSEPGDGADIVRSDPRALAAWVRAGGRLLIVGRGTFAQLVAGDLRLPTIAKTAHGEENFIAAPLRRLGVRRYERIGDARLSARRRDDVLLRDGKGVVALQYRLGHGEVLEVADGSMFRNGDVDRRDHARLAYALVAVLRGPRHSAVRFDEALHGYLTPEHWWQILPRRFVAALALATVVLGIALVGAAVRLGPPRAVDRPRAPTSVEFLDAMSSLNERARANRAALTVMVSSVRRLAAAHDATTLRTLQELQSHATRRPDDVVRGARLAYAVRQTVGFAGEKTDADHG